jgi:hypothetical protein
MPGISNVSVTSFFGEYIHVEVLIYNPIMKTSIQFIKINKNLGTGFWIHVGLVYYKRRNVKSSNNRVTRIKNY